MNEVERRAGELYQEQSERLYGRTDRLFAKLMIAQWIFGVGCAVWITPRTWYGASSVVHLHLLAAIVVGGVIASLPVWMAYTRPGRVETRHVIAVAQSLYSALLIHLMGGRIEAHFHVFGSLAFLAFYRDWRVLTAATVITGADHFLRGTFWPESVFGVIAPASWRWMEHAAWVIFEDVFLIYSCRQGRREMVEAAGREARLEFTNHRIEAVVEQRTHELAAARDRALEAARIKSEFLANMSHETRTPLNGVLGFLHLLEETDLTDHQRELVATVRESGEGLMVILDDILDLSKIDAHRMTLESVPFEPAKLLSSVGRLLAGRAAEKGISLTRDVTEVEGVYTLGDPTRVRQVLLNLVGNAVKFTAAGGVTLTARLARADGDDLTLAFEVRDTGIGIPADAVDDLFQPFHQVDGSTTRRFGGTGLGLAISMRLARLMGGAINVRSEPGVGSVFTLTVPLRRVDRPAPEPPPMATEPEPDESDTPQRSLRILVAEDNPINQRLAAALLRRRGHHVDLVADGREAVEAVERVEHPFDLVLMDAQMPVMDGFEATAAIRSMSGDESRTPIVALTAHAIAGYRQKCLDAGMDDYLTKPIGLTELDRVLAAVMASSGAADVDRLGRSAEEPVT